MTFTCTSITITIPSKDLKDNYSKKNTQSFVISWSKRKQKLIEDNFNLIDCELGY